MTQQINIKEPLTDDEVRRVTEFANALIARRAAQRNGPPPAPRPAHTISFEGWAGCLAGVEPEKSNKQLLQEAWDEVIDRSERAGGQPAK